MDTDRLLWIYLGVALCAAAFLLMHEKHYRSRRERIGEARTTGNDANNMALLAGLNTRLTVLEEIIMEERDN